MIRTRFRAFALAFVVVTATVTAGAGVTGAASSYDGDDTVIDSVFSSEDSDSSSSSEDSGISIPDPGKVASAASATGNYYYGKAQKALASRFGSTEDGTADKYANQVQYFVNSHNATILDTVNQWTTADTAYDTFSFTFQDQDGGSVTIYAIADVNTTTENYSSGRVVDTLPDGRTADQNYTLTPFASRNVREDLEELYDRSLESGERPEQSYLAKLAGKYEGEITGGELPSDS